MKTAFVVLVALALVTGAVLLALASGFTRRIALNEARVLAGPSATAETAPRTDLPPRVEAFAIRGLAGGTPAPALGFTQSAEMRLKPGARWTALTARQTVAATEPGFAWVATMRLGPLPLVRVIDSLADGAGRLEVRALGAVPMGLQTGPDATLGEAQRYLAELPWCPDAILSNRAIAWAAADDGITARLDTAAGPAVVLFGFDDAGDIVTVAADARHATLADGTPARLPWRGAFSEYREIGGRRIPAAGEVGYVYPEGYESYWRGRITGLEVLGGAR